MLSEYPYKNFVPKVFFVLGHFEKKKEKGKEKENSIPHTQRFPQRILYLKALHDDPVCIGGPHTKNTRAIPWP